MTWIETIVALREKHLAESQKQIEAALRVQVRDAIGRIKEGSSVELDPEPMMMAMRKVAMPTFADGFDHAAAFYGGDVKAGFLTGEEELLRYLQSFGMAKVKVINETTRRMLLEALIEGLDEGLDAFTIAERLYARWLIQAPTDGPISMARTENIARTEIGAALNSGSLSGAREVGMTHKVWSSVRDFRTRRPEQRGYDHYSNWDPETGLGAHGQTKMIDEPFVISGEQLMFPGDSSLGASAGSIINCRCSQTYAFKRR